MNEVRESIPYFLTKEYGDKQRKKHKILFLMCAVVCIGMLVIREILF